ncbi:MAG: DUF4435 domain-containing protein [Proteobacteria bacterium]|nr:DUF4435 domain-containing protein [Pseudomonadota bacterium]
MRQYLDENLKINEIRLLLRHPTGKKYFWVLVEGETDQKLFAKLIDGINTKVEMVHGGGIEPLCRAMSVLIQETKQVIGIRDADFLHLDQQQETINFLFLTDVHDAEMMILSCDAAFQSVVAEYLESRRTDFDLLRQEILNSIAFLGVIRWINNSESLKLNFKGLSLAAFIDPIKLIPDKQGCIQVIENRSPNKKRAVKMQEIDDKLFEILDYYNLCNGHDFEKAFALHITEKALGKNGINDVDIGKSLRIAFRKQDFEATKLYASLKQWEGQTGYSLFK